MTATNGIASEFELVTPPVGDVVSLTELRSHLKVDDNERNSDITAFAVAAVDYAQRYTRRQFLTATWRLHLSKLENRVPLRKCPVQSVTTLTYLDPNGNQQTLPGNYYLLAHREPAEVCVPWLPEVAPREDAVAITFVAGYGLASQVPELIKSAIKLKVEALFYGCEEELKPAIENLLNPYCWGI